MGSRQQLWSFLRSAEQIVDYLYNPDGLGLDRKFVLNLFDDDASGSDQPAHLRETLDVQLPDRREAGRPITDVLVYYVGHGHSNDQGHLSLLVRRSHRGLEAETGIKAPDFARHFSLLERYVASQGDALVPQRYRDGAIRLGGWVNERRAEYREGRLFPEKIHRFEQLRRWSWDPAKDQLERGFACLEAYVARHGSALVPVSCIDNGFKLGEWVHNRRQFHRRGILPQEQSARLEALPGWTWTPLSDRFEVGFGHLQAYVALHDHCRLPPGESAGEVNFRSWINHQRTEYHKGKLSHDRICRLESVVGWVWSQLDEQFEQGFAQLDAFVARNGLARVTRSLTVNGFKLGLWIAIRRRDYIQGKLSAERIRRLESVPEWKW